MVPLRSSALGLLVVLTHHAAALAQVRGLHVGAEAEYLFLIGNWRSLLESGPGGAAFAGYRTGPASFRMGVGLTFHHEEFGTPDVPSVSLASSGATRRIEHFFGEVRYRVPRPPLVLLEPPLVLLESIGMRLARLHAPSLVTPWAWHLEAVATAAIPLGPRPEIVAAAGMVWFPPENLPRSRTANSCRLGLSVAIGPGR